MASSSARNSMQELELFDAYTSAFARLYSAGCTGLVRDLTVYFEHILDMTFDQLINISQKSADWNSIVKDCYRLHPSTKVNDASIVIRNMAWGLLRHYGREADSVPCFQFADRLYNVANELCGLEQKAAAQRRGIY